MSIRQEIEDLLEINRQFRDQKRALNIYEALKIVLIGFFLSKRLNPKMAEITNQRNELINRIKEYFEQLNKLQEHLEELKNIDGLTAELEKKCLAEKILSYKQDLTFLISKEASNAFASLKGKDKKNIERTIQECAKKYLELKNEKIEENIQKIANNNTYLIFPEKAKVNKEMESFVKELKYFKFNGFFTEFCEEIQDKTEKYALFVANYNEKFCEGRKKEYGYIFQKDGFSLDEEQKDAVVKDDTYNLVVAGAGSGKTEVLITRIAYLIKRKPDTVMANRILAIAYQNKDVNQIQERLRGNYGIDSLEVKTFHKLGTEILQKAGEKFTRDSRINGNKKSQMIRYLFKQKLNQQEFYQLFLQYVKTIHNDEKYDLIETKAENLAYARSLHIMLLITLKWKVKRKKK